VRYSDDERPSRAVKRSRRYIVECKRLGLRVRRLRHLRSLTLESAAAKMNVDITHLQKIEAGKVNVSMVTLVRVADGMGLAMIDLFGSEPVDVRSPTQREVEARTKLVKPVARSKRRARV
jgi:transcriptional regulator with XRE-family HTH domain